MKRTALAIVLLLASACERTGPDPTTRERPSPPTADAPPPDTPDADVREPPSSPHGLAAAGALGYQLLLGDGDDLGDDDLRGAWQLLLRDPASAKACASLAEDAYTFRGWGLGLLGLAVADPAAVRPRLAEVLESLPVEAPLPTEATPPSLDQVCETLSPAARLALLVLEETPGHVLRKSGETLGPASLGALLADPQAREILGALAENAPTLHGRVAGLLGLAVLDRRAFEAALRQLREEGGDAPAAAAALAVEVLESTTLFEGEAVGEGGETPATCWAFRVLVAEKDAAERFRELAEDDRLPARIYAACGLRVVDPQRAEPLLAKLAAHGGTVGTFFGCIRSDTSVAELVEEIRTTEFARRLAGR